LVVNARRREYDPRRLHAAAELVLPEMESVLSDHPGDLARLLGVGGVAAGRIGQRRAAVRWLWRAFTLEPTEWRHLARLVRAVATPVRSHT
jgi:Flp pilus assembly protein TadD